MVDGVAQVYLQTVLHTFFSGIAWENFYISKFPVTAVHVINDRVLPFLEKQEVPVRIVLCDNGLHSATT